MNEITEAIAGLQSGAPEALATLFTSAYPKHTKIVELRFYGGPTEMEIGQVLGVSDRAVRAVRTVRRDWEKVRAALLVRIEE